jgi:hypothetical protein
VATLTTALFWLPVSIEAAPPSLAETATETRTENLPLSMARQAQAAGDWGEACYWYDFYLTRERNHPEVKKEFLLCLRNYYRGYRHSDPSFAHQVQSPDFKIGQALKFYEEVIAKIQKNYVDAEKATLGRLFREGVAELKLSLEDKKFRQMYVPDERQGRISGYLEVLRKRLLETPDLANAGALIREATRLSREAADVLGIDRRVVIVEFACGACNALDEYTFYISTSAAYAGRSGKTVDDKEGVKDGIGVLGISSFQETTVQELETALATYKAQGMQVLILDLRDNRGGSVEVAVDVVRRFLPDGSPIASTAGKVSVPYQSYTMTPLAMPLFVLIDGATASAAELVAGALKANKRAELIGQTTYGKNWIQQMVPIGQAPHGVICITWAQFFLPGTSDLSKGITPDIAVPSTPMNVQLDRVRQVALDRARMLTAIMR